MSAPADGLRAALAAFVLLTPGCGGRCPAATSLPCEATSANAPRADQELVNGGASTPTPIPVNVVGPFLEFSGAVEVEDRVFLITSPAACGNAPSRGELIGNDGDGDVLATPMSSARHPMTFTVFWDEGSCVAQSTHTFRLAFQGEDRLGARACPLVYELAGCPGSGRGPMLGVSGQGSQVRWRPRPAPTRELYRRTGRISFAQLGIENPWPSAAETLAAVEYDFEDGFRFIATSAREDASVAGLGVLLREQLIWTSVGDDSPYARIDVGETPLLLFVHDSGAWELRSMTDGRIWSGEWPRGLTEG